MGPIIGQTGQFISHAGGNPVPAIVKGVSGSTVDVEKISTTNNAANNLPFVDVGAQGPTGVDYFQAIN